MHYPTTPEKQEELSKKVAAVHAQTVMEQIKALPCPVEQKGMGHNPIPLCYPLIFSLRHVCLQICTRSCSHPCSVPKGTPSRLAYSTWVI